MTTPLCLSDTLKSTPFSNPLKKWFYFWVSLSTGIGYLHPREDSYNFMTSKKKYTQKSFTVV